MAQAPKDLRTELRKAGIGLRDLPRAARLFLDASFGGTVLWIALLSLLGILPAAVVILMQQVVDSLLVAIDRRTLPEIDSPLVLSTALLAGVLALIALLGALVSWMKDRQAGIVEDHIAGLIHRTAMSVDLAFYETPGYFDHLHRARMEALHRPAHLLETSGALIRSAITLVAMGALLVRFSPFVPLILLLSTLPALAVVIRNAMAQHRFRVASTDAERRAWYADFQLTAKESAAELRLFGIGPHYAARFQEIRRGLRDARLRLQRGLLTGQLLAGVAALLATGGCIVWMGFETLKGAITAGALVLFLTAFRQGQQMMGMLLSNVGDIYRNLLFLSDLFAYLDLKPAIDAPPEPVPPPARVEREVRCDGVKFTYPGTDRPVLNNFSLTLAAGRITAIVGENGAGKSTLIRLLCRFYDPDAGSICIDDTPLTAFDPDALRRCISVLFQTPVQYSETVAANIALFDPALQQPDRIRAAAEASGAGDFISKLDQQYDTLLGHWFDGGRELSVGQWQRISLSRAFLRDSSIVLLDEPTSAMDSWAEAEWLERLKEIVRDRTTLIITHRFTTAMKADIIHVMKDGAIIESGSHEELLALNGMYSASWKTQTTK